MKLEWAAVLLGPHEGNGTKKNMQCQAKTKSHASSLLPHNCISSPASSPPRWSSPPTTVKINPTNSLPHFNLLFLLVLNLSIISLNSLLEMQTETTNKADPKKIQLC